jgi:ligand-binding SRPBCC domain-containing protein
MPHAESTTVISCSLAEVFDFLSRPANLLAVTPPESKMRVVEGPEQLYLGARVVLESRRWGLSQRIVSEITTFERPGLLVAEQREGPFRKWVQTQRLEAAPEGTRLTDRIEFEAPGGLLGLVMTPRRIADEVQEIFTYRAQRFKELLERKTTTAE